ncbi:MAG: hypothetical protein WC423_07490, partial [Vulcanimicrobiota bacterium]
MIEPTFVAPALRETSAYRPQPRNGAAGSPPRQSQRADRSSVSNEASAPQSAMSEPFSSLLGQLRNSFGTTRAEKYEPDAEVAVFDEFRNADKPGVFTHGELVEGRLQE